MNREWDGINDKRGKDFWKVSGRWAEKWKSRGKLRRGHEVLIDPGLTSISRRGEVMVKGDGSPTAALCLAQAAWHADPGEASNSYCLVMKRMQK